MQTQVQRLARVLTTQQLRWALAALVAAVAVGLATPASANTAARVADREFADAVKQYKDGRRAEAFGRFIALANRGDVDAARIALFMHAYGPLLYGAHWEAGREEVEYWSNLVRNSGASGRAQPDFVPLAVVPKSRVKTVRATGKTATLVGAGD